MTAWPLDNTEYTAEAIGAWSGTRTRGVFSAEDCFAVTADGGFGILVSPGLAWLKAADWWGIAVLEQTETAFQLEVGSGLLARYAAVLLQYDKTAYEVRLALRYGSYSDAPEKPQPVRDEYFDEIILASILQPAAAVEITQADITDERLNEDVCGLMRDGVTGLPTAALYAQWDAFFERTRRETGAVQQQYAQQFEGWFARMRDQLSEDAAGHLQAQVDALHEADAALAGEVQIFEALLLADGWEPATDAADADAEAAPAAYTQTATCPGLLAAYDLEAPQVTVVGVYATDATLKEGLDALCEAGNFGETLDGAMRWVCYGSHPTVDLPLRLRRAAAGAGASSEESGGEAT